MTINRALRLSFGLINQPQISQVALLRLAILRLPRYYERGLVKDEGFIQLAQLKVCNSEIAYGPAFCAAVANCARNLQTSFITLNGLGYFAL